MNYINSSFGSPLDSSSDSFDPFFQKSVGPNTLEDEIESSLVFQNNAPEKAVSSPRSLNTSLIIKEKSSSGYQNKTGLPVPQLQVFPPNFLKNKVKPSMGRVHSASASPSPLFFRGGGYPGQQSPPVPPLVLWSANFSLADSKNPRDFKSTQTASTGVLEQKQVFSKEDKNGAPLFVISANVSTKSDIEKALTTKSKNILTLLFSIFITTGGGDKSAALLGGLSERGAELSSTLFFRRGGRPSGPVLPEKRVVERETFGRFRAPRNFIRAKNKRGTASPSVGGSPPPFLSYTTLFPFFILLYSLIVGFRGSNQKVISHQKRVSSTTVNNQVYKTSSTQKILATSSGELRASKLCELRFSEYSPLGVSLPRAHNFFQTTTQTKEDAFSSEIIGLTGGPSPLEKLLWGSGSQASTGQNSFVEKYFLQGVYISTQVFVFLTLQNLISENNFGRNNPLKQKDSKSNQARILWPKNNRLRSFRFWGKNARRQNEGIPDLPGIQEVTTLIEVLIDSLQKKTQQEGGPGTPPRRAVQTSSLPKGYLFVGPPGTGKTLLAQEIAQLAQVPFICVSASEIQKQIEIGTRIGALRLRKLFQQAQSLSPCILFFDEIDAIAQRQSQHDSKLFTEFLIQMDGFQGGTAPSKEKQAPGPSSAGGIGGFAPSLQKNAGGRTFGRRSPPHSVILGTTNYLTKLDSAFVRSGRFDRILALTYPSKKIRFDILVFYIKKTQFKKGNFVGGEAEGTAASYPPMFVSLGLNYFSFSTDGFSQAHLARLVNESLLFTISQNRSTNNFEALANKRVLVASPNSLRTDPKDAFQNMHHKGARGSSQRSVLSSFHSFSSLLHGLKQMQRHRKNLPQDNI